MDRFKSAPAMERLIAELAKLPSIGRKSAQRLAFHILNGDEESAISLAKAIVDVKRKIRFCRECYNITEAEICDICSNPDRDKTLICVVENVSDLYVFESSGSFKGRYHNLLGRISPLEGIMPEDLTIDKLISRVKDGGIKEVIIATNPDVAGEATASYIKQQMEGLNVKVTRIGVGIPIGGNLEYAGATTIQKSIEGRRDL